MMDGIKSLLRTILGPLYWWGRFQVLRIVFATMRPDHVNMPNGRVLYLDPVDTRSFDLWETSGNVNRRSMELWQALLRLCPWSLVLDVGANYGEMLLFPDLPQDARVYAFEPNSTLVPLLRRSLTESRVAAEVIESAVGFSDGHITFHIDLQWSGTSSVIAANTSATHKSVEVAVTRLDSFLSGLDGLKAGGN